MNALNDHSGKVRLYIGHKLTKANAEFLQKMANGIAMVEKELFQEVVVLKFLGLVGGTASDVYNKAIVENVGTCDLFVAIVDEESTGLGFELATALWKYKVPIVIVYTRGAHVSRLILGAIEHNSHTMLERMIDSPLDLVAHIREAILVYKIHERIRLKNPAAGWP